MFQVWCAVRSKEKFRVSADSRLDQGPAVAFPFYDWQAIMMGPNAARQNRVSIEHQVLWRDGRGNIGSRRLYKLHSLPGCDMFNDDT